MPPRFIAGKSDSDSAFLISQRIERHPTMIKVVMSRLIPHLNTGRYWGATIQARLQSRITSVFASFLLPRPARLKPLLNPEKVQECRD
jgi:hypothetical protein